jgi:hypothetical protein
MLQSNSLITPSFIFPSSGDFSFSLISSFCILSSISSSFCFYTFFHICIIFSACFDFPLLVSSCLYAHLKLVHSVLNIHVFSELVPVASIIFTFSSSSFSNLNFGCPNLQTLRFSQPKPYLHSGSWAKRQAGYLVQRSPKVQGGLITTGVTGEGGGEGWEKGHFGYLVHLDPNLQTSFFVWSV